MLVPATNGMAGQLAISGAGVLVVGAGGIGSTAIMYLAGAGVGRLGIVDFDTVDVSNLHRQIIYRSDEVGKLKAACAKDRVNALNPSVQVITHPVRMTYNNALDIVGQYDIVVDATDNFAVRYVINDACVFLSKPLVSGAAGGLYYIILLVVLYQIREMKCTLT
jgi:molybdopterin/thiamine biosynthesis adenylyltransferase